jgi:hypothetical protein
MPKLILLKRSFRDELTAADQNTSDFIHSLKTGQALHGDFKQMRNYQFHKRFFALLQFLYDHWEPGEFQSARWEGITPQKSFEQFRSDIIILAGFFKASYRLDGSVRILPKSISFSNMKQKEFEELYQRVIDVGLQKILVNYSRDELDNVIDNLLSFA